MGNHLFDELTIRAEAYGFTAEAVNNQLILCTDDGVRAVCVTPDGEYFRVRESLSDKKADRLMEIMRPEISLIREYVSRMESGPVIRAGGDAWRELAEYDGVVLAGKYCDNGGCRFVTWRRGQDGGMNLGHYFETDFVAARADFAVRSGLVPEQQQTAQIFEPEREQPPAGLKTTAVFKCKDADLEPRDCVVEKVIPLSGPAYDAFSRNLLRDYDFIRDNTDLMYRDVDSVMHCLLVIGENRPDGILVESEGYDYARYAALLPNAQVWLQSQEPELGQSHVPVQPQQSPALDSLCDRLNRLVHDIAFTAGQTEQGQQTAVDLRDAEQDYGVEILGSAALCHTVHAMLCERPELADLDFRWDKSEIIFTPVEPQMEPEIEPGPDLVM